MDKMLKELDEAIKDANSGMQPALRSVNIRLHSAKSMRRLIAKLREERDSWERVARRVEEEKQSAQQEIERLKQDADVIISYALERQKLIEGLRFYALIAKYEPYNSLSCQVRDGEQYEILEDSGNRAKSILKELGVTE